MKSRKPELHHLFLVLSILNMLMFFLFVGRSTIRNDRGISLSGNLFNHFFFVSFLVFITWLLYAGSRKKIRSRGLTLLHLLITGIIVCLLPLALKYAQENGPRRYLDSSENDSWLATLFGRLTDHILIVYMLLLISNLLLLLNIRQSSRTS